MQAVYPQETHQEKYLITFARLLSAFNAVMLVIGWWGLIGLVLAPVYFVQNLYYLARILTGPKLTASRDNST